MADVSSAPETLTDLVRRRLAELGNHGRSLSMREAARRSGNPGLYETIRKIVDGRHLGRLSTETAEHLARGLEVPAAQILRAAGIPQVTGEPFVLPARFARLTAQQRQVLISVGDAILRAAEDGAEEVRSRYEQLAHRQDVPSRRGGEIIEQARQRTGLSVADAADVVSISPQQWRAIVTGEHPANADTWLGMAIAVRADPNGLFTRLGIPLPARNRATPFISGTNQTPDVTQSSEGR